MITLPCAKICMAIKMHSLSFFFLISSHRIFKPLYSPVNVVLHRSFLMDTIDYESFD